MSAQDRDASGHVRREGAIEPALACRAAGQALVTAEC